MKSRIPTLILAALLLIFSFLIKDDLTAPQIFQAIAVIAILSAIHPFGDD